MEADIDSSAKDSFNPSLICLATHERMDKSKILRYMSNGLIVEIAGIRMDVSSNLLNFNEIYPYLYDI